MADNIVEVTKTGFGSRLMGSIKGIGFGILLFLASFFVLFNNEGSTSKSEILKTAQVVNSDTVASDLNGSFLAVSGKLETADMIGDGQFLKPGNYLVVRRNVEMYAWKENSSSKTETKLGGSQETTTTYSYDKGWVSSPADSANFKESAGHENPSMRYSAASATVSTANVGAYEVDPSKLSMPSGSALQLNADVLDLETVPGAYWEGGYVYVPVQGGDTNDFFSQNSVNTAVVENDFFGDAAVSSENDFFGDSTTTAENDFFGDSTTTDNNVVTTTTTSTGGRNVATNPQIGDLRITFTVLNSGVEGTLFGKLEGNQIKEYVAMDHDGERVYEFRNTSFEGSLSAADSAHSTKLWIMRLVGFMMMWMGLSMIVSPLSVLLDIIPFLGAVSRGFVGMVTFIVALVLSAVTILISMVLHSFVAVIIAALVGVGLVFMIMKKKAKNKKVEDVKA